jgi:OPA family glycerol-3-phosphate transporter-like MFS transporter
LNTDKASTKNPYHHWQFRILAATWLAYAGYYFCRKAFYVVKADLSATFRISTMELAQLGTAYLVTYMIGQFSSAYIGKKLGPKLLLLAGMGISILCNFAFGMSNGFWTIMLFLTINGLAQGTGWPGCIGSLAFWFKRKQRGSILGVWATCYQLGSVAATSFAAYLLGSAGWRWSFFGASLVLLSIWFFVLIFHPNKPENVGLKPIVDEAEPDEQNTPETKENANLKPGWSKDVILIILTMGAIYFCIKFLRYALWSWVPFFFQMNFHLAGDEAGYLSTVFDICGFAGVIFAGFISDRVFQGHRALLSFLMISGMTICFIIMYHLGAKSLFYFTVTMGLIGFMLYGPDSLLSGVGAIDVGSKKGALAAAGIINGMGSIGPIFQEQIIGWMYEFYDKDLLPILIMFVVVAIVGSILSLILWLNSKRGKSNL